MMVHGIFSTNFHQDYTLPGIACHVTAVLSLSCGGQRGLGYLHSTFQGHTGHCHASLIIRALGAGLCGQKTFLVNQSRKCYQKPLKNAFKSGFFVSRTT